MNKTSEMKKKIRSRWLFIVGLFILCTSTILTYFTFMQSRKLNLSGGVISVEGAVARDLFSMLLIIAIIIGIIMIASSEISLQNKENETEQTSKRWAYIAPYLLYGIIIILSMMIFVATGFGLIDEIKLL